MQGVKGLDRGVRGGLNAIKMKLKLQRTNFTDKYTEGILYINDVEFCKTLEDRTRDLNMDGDLNDLGEGKIYGETSIPYGTYKILLVYSPSFRRILPLLLAVKHFSGIMIHAGNYTKDTRGCILIGETVNNGILSNSRVVLNKLMSILKNSKQTEFEIEVI